MVTPPKVWPRPLTLPAFTSLGTRSNQGIMSSYTKVPYPLGPLPRYYQVWTTPQPPSLSLVNHARPPKSLMLPSPGNMTLKPIGSGTSSSDITPSNTAVSYPLGPLPWFLCLLVPGPQPWTCAQLLQRYHILWIHQHNPTASWSLQTENQWKTLSKTFAKLMHFFSKFFWKPFSKTISKVILKASQTLHRKPPSKKSHQNYRSLFRSFGKPFSKTFNTFYKIIWKPSEITNQYRVTKLCPKPHTKQ